MGQRGSVRIESGFWYGYFNEYVIDEHNGERKRKQRCIRLGPAEDRGKLSKWDAYEALAKEIAKTKAPANSPARDGTITFKQFAENHWKPQQQSEWRVLPGSDNCKRCKTSTDGPCGKCCPSRKSANHTLSHIYKKFGDTALENITRDELQRWLNSFANEYSASLVRHAKHYLKSILELAVQDDYISKNVANLLKIPNVRRVSKNTLTVEQFKAVLAELESPYDLIVKVAVACALRPSELLALRWRDLDTKAKKFTIRETVYKGKIRPYTKTTEEGETDQSLLTVPVPDELVKDLLAYRQKEERRGKRFRIVRREPLVLDFYVNDDDFIFHNLENGNFLGSENILFRVFDPVEEKLGLKLNFQVLRRTAATLAQHKGTVKDIQGLLRHKKPDMTMGEYAQVIPESTRSMVNALYLTLTAKPDKAEARK
jgi:integrase